MLGNMHHIDIKLLKEGDDKTFWKCGGDPIDTRVETWTKKCGKACEFKISSKTLNKLF